MDTKPTEEEYVEWLRKTHDVSVDHKMESYYRTVVEAVLRSFHDSAFWRDLLGQLKEFDGQYMVDHGSKLLLAEKHPELVTKPFDSFINKTYRKNVLHNAKWPKPPEGDWFLPKNWFTRINDMVRTELVVKYLDGVEFLLERLWSLCEKYDVACDISLEAREEGYYAAHMMVFAEYEVPRVDWDTERLKMPVEIQVTTQLQDSIRLLLHKYYAARRCGERSAREGWQWDYRSNEFAASYLGHILHYVEAMIVDVRDRQEREVNK